MAQKRLTQADIDQLASKLDQLGDALTETERAMLRFLFNLASEAIATLPAALPGDARLSRVGPGTGAVGGADTGTERDRSTTSPPHHLTTRPPTPERRPAADLPKLTEGFENAFQPGRVGSFAIDGIAPAAEEAEKQAIKVRLV